MTDMSFGLKLLFPGGDTKWLATYRFQCTPGRFRPPEQHTFGLPFRHYRTEQRPPIEPHLQHDSPRWLPCDECRLPSQHGFSRLLPSCNPCRPSLPEEQFAQLGRRSSLRHDKKILHPGRSEQKLQFLRGGRQAFHCRYGSLLVHGPRCRGPNTHCGLSHLDAETLKQHRLRAPTGRHPACILCQSCNRLLPGLTHEPFQR